jgi:hypothetical protein
MYNVSCETVVRDIIRIFILKSFICVQKLFLAFYQNLDSQSVRVDIYPSINFICTQIRDTCVFRPVMGNMMFCLYSWYLVSANVATVYCYFLPRRTICGTGEGQRVWRGYKSLPIYHVSRNFFFSSVYYVISNKIRVLTT